MKRRTRIVAVKKADDNHQVVTLKSDEPLRHYRRRPCEECPWRRDSPVGAFPAEAYRLSANTAHDMATHTFSCHMSGKERPQMCAGFLLRGATHSMAVRMATLDGRVDPRAVSDGGAALYDSYREMAEANGVDPKDPALKKCRD